MSARLLLPLLLLLAAVAPAHAQSRTGQPAVQVEPAGGGEVGMSMRVTISVAGDEAADSELGPLPEVPGARLALESGPNSSHSTVIRNGVVERSLRTEWVLELVPERAGPLQVGPFRVICRGEERLTSVLRIPVAESPFPPGTVQLELRASADELWQGQVFTLDVRASLDEQAADLLLDGGREIHLPWLFEAPSLLLLESPEPPPESTASVRLSGTNRVIAMHQSRDTSGAQPRLVLARKVMFVAVDAGEMRLPPSRFTAHLATGVREERGLFGGRVLKATGRVSVDAQAPFPPLLVREPPAEGRPPGFTNAVGRFALRAEASPSSLRVGDTCTLTLTATGAGNLDFLRWPEFEALQQDFRIFGKSPRKLPGTQVLEVQVSPKHARVTQIPALSLPYFDPDAGRFESSSAGPIPIEVLPGGEEGLVTLESPTETLSSLETVREALPEVQDGPPPAWALVLPGALALLLAEGLAWRRRWRADNPRLITRRGARRRLDEALDRARDARDLSVAFGRFLAERLDGPPAGLSAE
ncbi:MAG: protein BatD, partial [Planctomycetes bacterium]|nr:protein BatD [Planctomycetota bacterium]